ncbi:MAG: hypothetical protein HQK60_20180 [Deltaproteobacteria bacterium]|nr:hypothetical protein [Deltaproteobacteria bacterium]
MAQAGVNQWTLSGLADTYVSCLAVVSAGTVYAGTTDGVYKTINGGTLRTKGKTVPEPKRVCLF